jgi:predicted MFS family arabinose efflux permease
MQFYWLILGILAVWRISYLLTSESGPWNLLARMRLRLEKGSRGKLVSCLYCLSVWIAAPLAFILGESWKQRLMLWPALSAGAIFLERRLHPESPAPLYYEEQEDQEV